MRPITPALLFTTALLFSGCLREDPNPLPRPLAHECTVSGKAAPQWVCKNTDKRDGMLTVVALLSTQHSRRDLSFDKVRPSLRKGLTRQLQKNIKKEVDAYVRENGGFDDASAQNVSAGICADAAHALFGELRELARWKDIKAGKTYLLTGIARAHADRTVKAHGAQAMLRLSPLKQWAQQRSAFGQNATKASMQIPPAKPPFVADEPMTEVVTDSFVGVNKRR